VWKKAELVWIPFEVVDQVGPRMCSVDSLDGDCPVGSGSSVGVQGRPLQPMGNSRLVTVGYLWHFCVIICAAVLHGVGPRDGVLDRGPDGPLANGILGDFWPIGYYEVLQCVHSRES